MIPLNEWHACEDKHFEAAVYSLMAEDKAQFRAHYHAKLTIEEQQDRVELELPLEFSKESVRGVRF